MTDLSDAIRRAMGTMTQAELARRCAVTDATVSNWLAGRRCPSIGRLASIAAACGVPVAQLMESRPITARDTLPMDYEPSIEDAPPPGDER